MCEASESTVWGCGRDKEVEIGLCPLRIYNRRRQVYPMPPHLTGQPIPNRKEGLESMKNTF